MSGRTAARDWLAEIITGARFIAGLPAALRNPLTPAAARMVLRQRFERREMDFLDLARRTIYDHRGSPYRELLRLAGCEYGDLARLVTRDGLEGALVALYRQEVYLTVEEFKGRRPTVRGAASIDIDPSRCRNPLLAGCASMRGPGACPAAAGTLVSSSA